MRRRLPPPLRRANAGRSNPTPNEPEHTRRRGGVAVVDPCGGAWHRRIAGAGRLPDLSRDRGGDHGRGDVGARRSIPCGATRIVRSDEHTSELQSLMRISYAVFCLKKTTMPKPCSFLSPVFYPI